MRPSPGTRFGPGIVATTSVVGGGPGWRTREGTPFPLIVVEAEQAGVGREPAGWSCACARSPAGKVSSERRSRHPTLFPLERRGPACAGGPGGARGREGHIMEPANKFLYKHKGCYFVPEVSLPEKIDSLESFEIRDDDIFIITYPKSGTIWTQNIVSLILHEGHRDGTENINLLDRAPWLESNVFHVDFSSRPSPRLFTSHLPYYLVPKGLQNKRAKIIYVLRNPKDVLVSTYHFSKITPVRETPKDFDTFLEWFLAGRVPSSLWLDHVEGWYAHKGDFNILFLSYEEMKKDLRRSVLKICSFLGKKLTEKEVDDVVDKATFDKMKVDSRANYTFMPSDIVDCSKGDFLRKGTVGDWKNIMTVAQSEKFDRVFKERMEKLPFRFCWDIQEDPEPISSSVEENNV